MKLTWT